MSTQQEENNERRETTTGGGGEGGGGEEEEKKSALERVLSSFAWNYEPARAKLPRPVRVCFSSPACETFCLSLDHKHSTLAQLCVHGRRLAMPVTEPPNLQIRARCQIDRTDARTSTHGSHARMSAMATAGNFLHSQSPAHPAISGLV